MKKLLAVIFALFMLAGCAPTPTQPAQPTSSEKLDYEKQSEWEFTSGKMQSPIDIVTSTTIKSEDALPLTLTYSDTVEKVEDNGHAIEAEMEGSAMINGRHFELAQFHIHAQSEHTIDGKHSPLEIHFVHKAENGRLAVVAVMVEVGTENPAFEQVLETIGSEHHIENFEAAELLPKTLDYYHYLGSLTTPPLTENVEWYVLKDTITISEEQLTQFHTYYTENNRDVQDLNDRHVLSSI